MYFPREEPEAWGDEIMNRVSLLYGFHWVSIDSIVPETVFLTTIVHRTYALQFLNLVMHYSLWQKKVKMVVSEWDV